jgi:TonB-dependent SusC/RagA subfamily outer membrane receptor
MKLRLFFLLIISVLIVPNTDAQKSNKKFTVSGYVKDSNDNPVVGAMILLDNKNTGKVTDGDGFYKLKVKPDNKTLTVFTLYGASTTIPIEGHTLISFILKEAPFLQNDTQNKIEPDVVLDTGYGVVKKDLSAQSVDKINVTETDYSSYNNIYDLIRSKAPSVEVIGDKVYIRGTSTLIGGSDPLFIVDGCIMESIENIQPSIVKSIDVLKGNSASMYGVRGSNGVIIINTIK